MNEKIKNDLKILRKLLIKIFSILFIIIIILKFLSNFFIINITKSLPIGIYKKINKENIEVGDYVLFKIKDKEILNIMLNNHYIFNSNENILKKVVGIENDIFTTKKDDLFFKILFKNGKRINIIKEKDSLGRQLPQIKEKIIVKNGEIFVMGTHTNSFDSRYFGTIYIKDILSVCEPFLIF